MRKLFSTLIVFILALGQSALAQDFPVVPTQKGKASDAQQASEGDAKAHAPRELITPFQLADRFVLPGNRESFQWQNDADMGPGEGVSPVIISHGAKAGPVLCLIGGVHGDEINGIALVRRMAYEIDPEQLSGTLISVPIVNVFGYSRGSRYLPDRRDLNRYFPGSRSGSIASRVAQSLFDTIIRRCDAVIDFHTGSFQRSNLPQVRGDLTNPKVLNLSHGFGGTLVLHSPGSRGMLRVAAMEAGIPAVTMEIGAPLRLEVEHIEPTVLAIRRLMAYLKMTDSDVSARRNKVPPVFFESRWVRSNIGGLLISDVKLGQNVRAGQVLGRVIDPLSQMEKTIRSPFDGRLIGMALNQQVLPGYAAYHLAKLTDEQQAIRDATAQQGLDAMPEDDPEHVPNQEEESAREESEYQ